eukprot:6075468-Prymnesium_polylepis.2
MSRSPLTTLPRSRGPRPPECSTAPRLAPSIWHGVAHGARADRAETPALALAHTGARRMCAARLGVGFCPRATVATRRARAATRARPLSRARPPTQGGGTAAAAGSAHFFRFLKASPSAPICSDAMLDMRFHFLKPARISHLGNLYSHMLAGWQPIVWYENLQDTSPNCAPPRVANVPSTAWPAERGVPGARGPVGSARDGSRS